MLGPPTRADTTTATTAAVVPGSTMRRKRTYTSLILDGIDAGALHEPRLMTATRLPGTGCGTGQMGDALHEDRLRRRDAGRQGGSGEQVCHVVLAEVDEREAEQQGVGEPGGAEQGVHLAQRRGGSERGCE